MLNDNLPMIMDDSIYCTHEIVTSYRSKILFSRAECMGVFVQTEKEFRLDYDIPFDQIENERMSIVHKLKRGEKCHE